MMILNFLISSALIVNAAEPLPFWKAKKEIYKTIKEDRAIVVSAKTDQKLLLNSAGRIHAPYEYTHKKVLEFDKYSELLPHIDEASFDQKTQNLFLHSSLLGFHARMTMKMTPRKTSAGYTIDFEVISGNFKGLQGKIIEDQDGPEHTEISMEASYAADDIGIPKVITGLILEIAGRRMAAKMRSYIEDEWEKSRKISKKPL